MFDERSDNVRLQQRREQQWGELDLERLDDVLLIQHLIDLIELVDLVER